MQSAITLQGILSELTTCYMKISSPCREQMYFHYVKASLSGCFRYANNTNVTFSFHGPRGADETPGPVKWIRPYFDCGRSNTWKFAAVVPIVDIFPRHTQFRHIEYPVYTSAAVMELDFDRIDINQVSFVASLPDGTLIAYYYYMTLFKHQRGC